MKKILAGLMLLALAILACGQSTPVSTPPMDRPSSIPSTTVKHSPTDDFWPPTAAAGWSQPEPLPGPINTAGGEDSPFVTPDGNDLYFFFTPDVSIPAEKQLLDGVTGIWVAHRSGDTWSMPERVWLQEPGKLALDGCEFVLGNLMYFCTAREGYVGTQWFRAEFRDGTWQDWRFAGDELKQSEYEVGELHISADRQELYFGSSRAGGYGGLDLWISHLTADGWSEPVNLGPPVNTEADESRPFVCSDGQELWFTGQSTKGQPGPAIFRSLRRLDGTWGAAEEIISTFAGEPTLSPDGKALYFIHHYFSQDLNTMLEADIYVSYKTP
jgi:predicted small lipoprotein YifL